MQRRSFSGSAASAMLGLCGALFGACANAGNGTSVHGGDLAVCEGAVCHGGCDSDRDCPRSLLCDPSRHTCVACVGDGDCPSGTLCDRRSGACESGCSQSHGCPPDGGVCEVDAGVCVPCVIDGDCLDPANPFCDPIGHRCADCLPNRGGCSRGFHCVVDQTGPHCTSGCAVDSDCGNSGDGGVPDGGVRMLCCNGQCVDPSMDPMNCGACNSGCSGGWNCCNSQCTDPNNDVNNCGGCGFGCSLMNATAKCQNRACAIASCNMGFGDCNGVATDGCETSVTGNVFHCGSCGNACMLDHALPKCVAGACQIDTCAYPWDDCDNNPMNGCETNTHGSDLANCGGCSLQCSTANATPVCNMGNCQISACSMGFGDCNNDPRDGCETNLQTSAIDCGACGNTCITPNATPACTNGACAVGSCASGWGDCNNDPRDGCEANLTSDVGNCGACGTTCANPNGTTACVNGACTCACSAGFVDCSGKCAGGCQTHVDVDPQNCGGCGIACSNNNVAAVTCAAGVCNGVCAMGHADCNGNKQVDGCEVDLNNDAANCGACGNACPMGFDCVGGACTCATQGVCTPGQTRTINCGNCGAEIDTCDSQCQWSAGACMGQGVCAVGATRTVNCGNCGSETDTCSAQCQWTLGNCTGQGACTPGALNTHGCGNCGTETDSCGTNCQWSYGACNGQGPCSPGQTLNGACDPCGHQVCQGNCQWGGCQLNGGAQCFYQGGGDTRGCTCNGYNGIYSCGGPALQWCLPSCVWSTQCDCCAGACTRCR